MNLIKKEKINGIKNAGVQLFNKTTAVLNNISPIGAGINHKELKNNAYIWTDEIISPGSIFTNPMTPRDLRKTQTRTIRSKSGKLISGLTLAQDWTVGADTGIKTIPLALMLAGVITTSSMSTSLTGPAVAAAIGLAIYNLAGAKFGELFMGAVLAASAVTAIKYLDGASTLAGAMTFMLPAAYIYLNNYLTKKGRAQALLNQSRTHRNDLGDTDMVMKRLEKQITQGIKDDSKSPFLPIAIATGKFQERGSFESPDAGTEIGFNLSDLAQHIFVMGMPGTGKSYLLRQIINEANEASIKMGKKIGMLLMDGKGELAGECAPILDLIVNPKNVDDFCLIDGVDATKWTLIIQAMNGVKFDGQNAEFARAAMELVYSSALAHIFLKDIAQDDPELIEQLGFKWNYMFRFNLMSMMLAPGGETETNGETEWIMGKGEIIIELLKLHKNYETDPRIKQLIFGIEGELSPERQDFAMKYLKTAQGYMQAVLQSESIIKWAYSETTSVDVLDCLKGKKVGVALPPERFGLAGTLVTQLIKAKVRNAIANRENDWRTYADATELLFVQDEFQDLFSEFDDLNNIPKDRSRGCYNVVASQTVSAIYSKISNTSTADYLFANFSSIIGLKTDDKKANELLQSKCGTVDSFKIKTPISNSIAFKETAESLLSKSEYDPTHPDALMFKKFRGDLDFQRHDPQNKTSSQTNFLKSMAVSTVSFVFGATIATLFNKTDDHIHSISEYIKDDKQAYTKLLGDEMFNMLDNPQHAVVILKRGGIWVRDIAIVKGVDPNFKKV